MKIRYFIVFALLLMVIPVSVDAMSIDSLLFLDASCQGTLGSPDTPGTTAYLLQEIFDVIKLAVPVLLIVLTVIEFMKAVTSGKDDAIKVAFKHTITRLILGLIIFLLPTLIDYIMELLGLYDTCGIR